MEIKWKVYNNTHIFEVLRFVETQLHKDLVNFELSDSNKTIIRKNDYHKTFEELKLNEMSL
jgi:hypothetical protein